MWFFFEIPSVTVTHALLCAATSATCQYAHRSIALFEQLWSSPKILAWISKFYSFHDQKETYMYIYVEKISLQMSVCTNNRQCRHDDKLHSIYKIMYTESHSAVLTAQGEEQSVDLWMIKMSARRCEADLQTYRDQWRVFMYNSAFNMGKLEWEIT